MPYGILDGDLEPRWTFGRCTGRVEAVDFLEDLPNAVVPARMQQKIHKISGDNFEEDTFIDLTQGEEEAARKSSRVLIRPNLERIRDRNKADDIEPENIVPVTDKEIKKTIKKIEQNASVMRKHFLEEVIPLMVGYDIAAGEAEAIARDELETNMAIDSEIAYYLERATVCSLLSRMLRKKFTKEFVEKHMGQWLDLEFAAVREQVSKEKQAAMRGQAKRRLMDQYGDLIAQRKGSTEPAPIGMTRSMPKPSIPEFFFDK